MYTLEMLRADYVRKWTDLTVRAAWVDEIQAAAHRIAAGASRYAEIQKESGVPWWMIGLLHELEASCNFARHLHNGDLLSDRTHNKPSGRPLKGGPPFTFRESALDALAYDGLDRMTDWSVGGVSFALEKFNGFGYRTKSVCSPYLYSGSFWYLKGKYVRDGPQGFDPDKVSKQAGAVTILKVLQDAGSFKIEVR